MFSVDACCVVTDGQKPSVVIYKHRMNSRFSGSISGSFAEDYLPNQELCWRFFVSCKIHFDTLWKGHFFFFCLLFKFPTVFFLVKNNGKSYADKSRSGGRLQVVDTCLRGRRPSADIYTNKSFFFVINCLRHFSFKRPIRTTNKHNARHTSNKVAPKFG